MFIADFISKFKCIIIIGDFNIDKLSKSRESNYLSDIIDSFSLRSLVNEPTRIDLRQCFNSSTAIDYVITNLLTNYEISIIDSHISDHEGQLFNYSVDKNYCMETVYNNRICRIFSEQNMFNFANLFYEK